MATVRKIQIPAELGGSKNHVLSPDGRTVACRWDGERAGLYTYVAGGRPQPARLDEPGRRYLSPRWSESGDLLFRVEGADGARVGGLPAQGRGSAVEFEGSGIAVSVDGRVLAVADPAHGKLLAAVAQPGNSPFNEPLRAVGELRGADPEIPVELQVTRDSNYILLVRRLSAGSPSLWSFPVEEGDGQELVSGVPAPGFMSFALSKTMLATLEIRLGLQPSSRLCVRPLAAGSLGALRLGPALDLLFLRHPLSEQQPGFSPDGKKLAVLVASAPALPGGPPPEPGLDLFPSGGGYPQHVLPSLDVRGSARFLENGEIAVEGLDKVAVVTL